MRLRLSAAIFLLTVLTACARSAGVFSEQNARAHVDMLAGTIGSRPVGTDANARARAYIVDQLKQYGFDVRVQETDARRATIGRTAHVSNVVAVLAGSRREAIALVSHYDSSPYAPGAADDGLGVAVSLEAARLLAARQNRQWSVFVLVTDGEEAGLMGAAGLMTDRDVTDRVRAYVNIEAVGSAGNSVLFETGPGNGWLVAPWARRAPHPRGGSDASEVYRRLPNDTDFTIFKRQEIPGLNFAPIGDSYAYHTARDTAERLSPKTVRQTGENVVAIATALDAIDITQRNGADATYFDLGGTVGLSYGRTLSWLLAILSLLLGVLAWLKMTAAAIRLGGVWRWMLTAVWSVVGTLAVVGSMIGTTWLLRIAREVYHPWYARPGRMLLLLVAVGVTLAWTISRAGTWLPARAHGMRHPVMTWSMALPVWIVLAGTALWFAPAAAYLWTVPLAAAAVLLLLVPTVDTAVRAASVVILAVAGTLWLRETLELSVFMVAVFGRLPVITPAFVYAALLAVSGTMLAPAFAATLMGTHPIVRPKFVTALLLLAVVGTAAWAYVAPGYTYQEPLRRHVRALQEAGSTSATWEVGSTEPGLDLEAGAPQGWARQHTATTASVPWGTMALPFVFRTNGPSLGPPPIDISGFTVQPVAAGTEVTLSVVPHTPGLTVSFVAPAGLTPARSTLPGVVRLGRWTATYVAVPSDGIAWHASFSKAGVDALRELHIAVTDNGFPGGGGWQRLPAWLPQDRTVWSGTATWSVPAGAQPPIAPVPPLR